jgi:hypothetical protein
MSAPVGTPPDLAIYLAQLELRLAALEEARSPLPAFACSQANLPSAAQYINCVVRVTDLNILAASDGATWRRQDTGAAI